ncbi:hypothetical protein [Alkalihalobacillus sp. AL-G]|uniref:hypothetical protein n=1 Tax=Alkalihalobacillus sp. AL-G TaxID=2926399 RepID=UPI002729E625|nr:hypothetical protein [Alkalihalobacillus sp. AL-G]WLD94361.1 hypothetical protein MOJ78_05590 [Alkalihalobacillus sp. AL-G]
MSKVIKNINFLDLTGASAESLEGVTVIKNINTLLYSKKVTNLLSKFGLKNVNNSIEVPENTKLIKGDFELNESFGKSLNEAIHLAVKGTLLVKPNVTVDTIEKLSGITLFGDLLCPERLVGLLHQKIENHLGDVMTFMDDADVILNDTEYNDHYLKSLKTGTNIVVNGTASFPDNIDASLLNEKIGKFEFLDEAIIREELMDVIGEKIQHPEKCKMTIIPKGSVYIGEDLHLDSSSIKRFQSDRLYVSGTIHLESDVTLDALEQCIEKFHTEDWIICRKELMQSVLKKCEDPSVSILSYTGKLLVIDGEHHLTQAQLKYTKENLTMIVRGILDIADNVDPEELFNKIDGIHNYGVIDGSEDQCGVIQTKLVTNRGVIGGSSHEEKEEDDKEENVIANMNYLQL